MMEFYIDITCTTILGLFDIFIDKFYEGSDESSNIPSTTDNNSEHRRNETKKTILGGRVVFGFIISAMIFIISSIMNKETIRDEKGALAFCAIIAVYTVLFYYVIVYAVLLFLPDQVTDYKQRYHTLSFAYRFCETIFDILMLFYSLILSRFEMTTITMVVTVVSVSDLILNIGFLISNICQINGEDREHLIVFVVICVFCPFLIPVIVIYSCIAALSDNKIQDATIKS